MVKEHLTNQEEFWLAYPVASYANKAPDYYQGSHKECNWRGSTWAPTNYMIFQGLMRYGEVDVARELARRLFEMAVVKNPVLPNTTTLRQARGWGKRASGGLRRSTTSCCWNASLKTMLRHWKGRFGRLFRKNWGFATARRAGR